MKQPVYPEMQFKSDYEYVLKKFNLTDAQFQAYMNAPIRKHTEFKNIQNFRNKYFAAIKFAKKIFFLKKYFKSISITQIITSVPSLNTCCILST